MAYDQYALLSFFSKDVLEKQEACFPFERAARIYFYAIILCANGFLHMDQIDDLYQERSLPVIYKDYACKCDILHCPACPMNLDQKAIASVHLSSRLLMTVLKT